MCFATIFHFECGLRIYYFWSCSLTNIPAESYQSPHHPRILIPEIFLPRPCPSFQCQFHYGTIANLVQTSPVSTPPATP